MNDYLLTSLVKAANKIGTSHKIILLMSGAIIIGTTAQNSSVSSDILRGIDSEDFALEIKQKEQAKYDQAHQTRADESSEDLLSLRDVTIIAGAKEVDMPFLRIQLSEIDAWFSGGHARAWTIR